ncbi:hypothetical protein IAQ61_000528 [Plenodomus lingam]|uniref:uncharacterized protein n=1 Tax=Leptosphaeria maculans TaxID=5022 RepID=UPI00332975D1|nr:hypothetical protein IAQ61_000528 [Plenodomus lingam]
MKLFTAIMLFVAFISMAFAAITSDATTVPAVPTVIIPPVTLTSGAAKFCENIGEVLCIDNQKITQCTEFHELIGFTCPGGCDTDEGMNHCLGVRPATASLAQHLEHCPTIDEKRCVDRTVMETCGYHHTWVFLRDCPLGCGEGPDMSLCDGTDGSTLPPLPTTLIITPSTIPEITNERRNDGPCKPWSRACDSERRFLFICGENGRWDEGRQCNRANGCKIQGNDGLTCAGHPHFYYDDNRICERRRSCEIMGYKYCLAVSRHRYAKIVHTKNETNIHRENLKTLLNRPSVWNKCVAWKMSVFFYFRETTAIEKANTCVVP